MPGGSATTARRSARRVTEVVAKTKLLIVLGSCRKRNDSRFQVTDFAIPRRLGCRVATYWVKVSQSVTPYQHSYKVVVKITSWRLEESSIRSLSESKPSYDPRAVDVAIGDFMEVAGARMKELLSR
jgi:hypothetical protein